MGFHRQPDSLAVCWDFTLFTARPSRASAAASPLPGSRPRPTQPVGGDRRFVKTVRIVMERIADDDHRAQWSVFGLLQSLRQHVANIRRSSSAQPLCESASSCNFFFDKIQTKNQVMSGAVVS